MKIRNSTIIKDEAILLEITGGYKTVVVTRQASPIVKLELMLKEEIITLDELLKALEEKGSGGKGVGVHTL